MSNMIAPLIRLLCLFLLSASVNSMATPPNNAPEVFIDGELIIVHIDYEPGKGQSKFVYHLKEQGSNEIFDLEFEQNPPKHLRTGDKLNVRGKQVGKKLWVMDISGAVQETGTTAQQETIAPQVEGAATQYKALYMLVTMVDGSSSPLYSFSESDRSAGENVMFNNTYSVDSVNQEGSFGKVAFPGPLQSGGKAIIVTIVKPADNTDGSCNYNTIASLADTAAGSVLGGSDSVSNYNRKIYWVPPNSVSHCNWLALGQVGNYGSASTYRSWTTTNNANAIIHEEGHNHGWHHAGTDFDNNEVLDSGTSGEYGDTSGAMGYCCNQRKFNSVHLHQIGWLPAADVVTVASSGTYRIAPLGDAGLADPQLLIVEKGSSAYSYYLSYRQVKNLDLNLGSTYTQGVNIHNGRMNDNWSYFVQSLTDGGSFEDVANGIYISQISHDSAGVVLNIVIAGPQPPADPTNLTAATVSDTAINVAWNDNADNETGYSLERSDDGVNGWQEVAQLAANSGSHTDVGLTPSTTYYYRVIAKNGSTPSANYSNVDGATTDDPPPYVDQFPFSENIVTGTVSGIFTDTYADDGNTESITERESGGKPNSRYSYLEHGWSINVKPGNAVTLFINAWSSASSDGDAFEFEYSTDGGANYAAVTTVSNTSDNGPAPFVLPNNINGTVYLRVKDTDRSSGNKALDTLYVDQIFIRSENQPGGTAPATPPLQSATAVSANQVDIAWGDVADEYGYEIERSTNSGAWTLIDTVGADMTSYQDTAVAELTNYSYRLRAYNGSGSSENSNELSVATPEGPVNVINLSASGYKDKGIKHATLIWNGASSANVDIYRDDVKLATTANDGSHDDNIGSKGSGSYGYQVCDAGTSNCSPVQTVVF